MSTAFFTGYRANADAPEHHSILAEIALDASEDELTEEEREEALLEAEEAYREASAEAADWVARGLWS